MFKRIILIVSFTALLVFPVIARADTCDPGIILPPCICSGDCYFDDFVSLFVNLANWGFSILGVITVLLIIWSAWGLMISAGNPEKIKAGRQGIVNTLLGLFFVLTAWVLVNGFFVLLAGEDDTGKANKVFGQPWYSYGKPDETAKPCPGDRVCTSVSSFSEERKKAECGANLKCPGKKICCDPCPTGQTCTDIVGMSLSAQEAGHCKGNKRCTGDEIKDKKGKTIDDKYEKYFICCDKPASPPAQ